MLLNVWLGDRSISGQVKRPPCSQPIYRRPRPEEPLTTSAQALGSLYIDVVTAMTILLDGHGFPRDPARSIEEASGASHSIY